MLAFVPVTLDLYRTVRRHLHWTLQNLVSFANHAGKCWPSVRVLAATTGQPRSTVSRHLAQLAKEGVIARQRRPGGVYAYTDREPLPAGAARGVPPARAGVSHRQEEKNRQIRKQGRASALDLQNQESDSARCSTIAPNGRRGYAAGASRGFGCRSGVQSRTEPDCFAPASLMGLPLGLTRGNHREVPPAYAAHRWQR